MKLTDKLLKELEEKITKKIIGNIDNMFAEKCKEIFQNQGRDQPEFFSSATPKLDSTSTAISSLQEKLKMLSDKMDHTIGGLSYVSSEYDDLSTKYDKISLENQRLSKEIMHMQNNIASLKKRASSSEIRLDNLEEYGRRENLEIHGIPVTKKRKHQRDNQKVASILSVNLDSKNISTSHKLSTVDTKMSARESAAKSSLTPPIIVRFANRDKRNELYCKRSMISKSIAKDNLPSNFMPENLALKENLTKFRKSLFNETKKKIALNYKFLWTWQGQIFIRENESSRVYKISTWQDLDKLDHYVSCTRPLN